MKNQIKERSLTKKLIVILSKVQVGSPKLIHVNTHHPLADILTKLLCIDQISILHVENQRPILPNIEFKLVKLFASS